MFGTRKTAPAESGGALERAKARIAASLDAGGIEYRDERDENRFVALFDKGDRKVVITLDEVNNGNAANVRFRLHVSLPNPVDYLLFLECLNVAESALVVGDIHILEGDGEDYLAAEAGFRFVGNEITPMTVNSYCQRVIGTQKGFFDELFAVARGEIRSVEEFRKKL